jgi:hypothetical protein
MGTIQYCIMAGLSLLLLGCNQPSAEHTKPEAQSPSEETAPVKTSQAVTSAFLELSLHPRAMEQAKDCIEAMGGIIDSESSDTKLTAHWLTQPISQMHVIPWQEAVRDADHPPALLVACLDLRGHAESVALCERFHACYQP